MYNCNVAVSLAACALALCVLATPSAAEEDRPIVEFRKLALRGGIRSDATLHARLNEIENRLTDPVELAELRQFRAECWRRGGNLEAAERTYTAIIEDPDVLLGQRLRALRGAAEATWLRGDLSEADRRFQRLLHALPPNGEVAAEDMEFARMVSLMRVATRHHRAAILASLGRSAEAIEVYEEAIRANTPERVAAVVRGFTNQVALWNIATAQRRSGDDAAYLRTLRRLRQVDATYRAAYVDYEILTATGPQAGTRARADALRALLKKHEQDPWSLVIRMMLSYELVALKDGEGAREQVAHVIATRLTDPHAYEGLVREAQIDGWRRAIRYALHLTQYAKAEDLCGEILQQYPDHRISQFVRDDVMPRLAEFRSSGETEGIEPSDAAPPVVAAAARGRDLETRMIWTNVVLVIALAAWLVFVRRARSVSERSAS